MAKRNKRYHLYFVETPSPEENCFVAATSAASAAKFERDGSGFDGKDCVAIRVRDLAAEWVQAYRDASKMEEGRSAEPFYVFDRDVESLGVSWTVVEGDDYFSYGDLNFFRQGNINYVASIVREVNDPSHDVIIRSVSDLLGLVRRDAPGEWIFRGQASCTWRLEAGAFRGVRDEATSLSREKRSFAEFRRRARAFLPDPPTTVWEWLFLAQHYGLPTRLLDWTGNPLVGLYFAVTKPAGVQDDGILYAYRHGAEDLDMDGGPDPFSIKHVELVRPPHIDRRLIVQESIFTAEPFDRDASAREGSEIVSWNVSAMCTLEIQSELESLGLSESALFPGLDSLVRQLKRKLF